MANRQGTNRSHDAYGDFMVRIVNSVRLAENQAGTMSEHEFSIVERVRDLIEELDPPSMAIIKANIIIRPRR